MSITESTFFILKKDCSVKIERIFGGIAEKYYKDGKYFLLRIRGINKNAHFKILETKNGPC